MNKRKKINILVFSILTGALFVRLWGIDFGLPYEHFGDEGQLAYWAFYSGSHALRPPYYLYAPFVPMILLIEFSFYYIGGYLLSTFSSPPQFFIKYLIDPTIFFLIGRITMALFGVATVWLVFIVGKKFFNIRVGLIAAFFLGFSFLHTKESHYIKQDVLMGFFVLSAFYFAMNIFQKRNLRAYVLCGIAFALAFGAKYHAIILSPVILVAHFFNAKKIPLRRLILLGIAFLVTFSIIHPYFILETKLTLQKTIPFASRIRVGYPEQLQGKSVWWWFLFEHIPQGLGYPLFIAAIFGFVVCSFRGLRQKVYLFLPLLPLIFFITIDFFTQMHFARYAVMVLPFFTLAAAIFLDTLSRFLEGISLYRETSLSAKLVLVISAIVLISPTFFRTIKFDYLLTKQDTRTLAKHWFEQHVPSGSKVLVESTLKPEYPSSFNAPLFLDENSLGKRIQEAEKRVPDVLYLRSLEKANKDKIGYDIVATIKVDSIRDIFTDKQSALKDVGFYVENRIKYIVLTSWAQDKMSQEFEKSLNDHYRLIKEFRPTYEFNTDPHLVRVDYVALDSIDIFRKNLVFGPVVSVYRIN